MSASARGASLRIPGGPPLETEDLVAFYGENEVTGICGEAPSITSLQDSISSASIYGLDQMPLFGPQYGGISRKRKSAVPFGMRGSAAQEDKPTVYGIASCSLEAKYSNNTSTSTYEGFELPAFGPRHGGTSVSSFRRNRTGLSSTMESEVGIPKSRTAKLKHAWLSNGEEVPKPVQISTPAPLPPIELLTLPSCTICTEEFSATIVLPKCISQNCLHPPTVCSDCLVKCIKIDVDTKVWNQIKCPECSIFLIYDDIRRLADPETFSRYEQMSFRSAVSADEDFVWCQNCDFGQVHSTGESQPIVRCLTCGFKSCYRHSTPWHERLTCEEYDKMVEDPDGFRSAIELDEEAAISSQNRQEEEDETVARYLMDTEGHKRQQEEDDEALARSLFEGERLVEQDRQRQSDEAEAEAARRARVDADEMLARLMVERERQTEQNRQRQRHEEHLRHAKQQQEAEARRMRDAEQAQRKAAIKRKNQEEKMSLATVRATTKACPGCRWPIEKNDGCSHMTCTQCRHEFCWECGASWRNHLRCSRIY